MGNLVDTFIITPNEASPTDINRYTRDPKKRKEEIVNQVGDKYRSMLSFIIDEFMDAKGHFDISYIIEPTEENWDIILRVTDDLSNFDCDFDDRYRGDCLRQELRRVFFDTVCIIENDYCINKTNHFKIVGSKDLITEEEWEKSKNRRRRNGTLNNNS